VSKGESAGEQNSESNSGGYEGVISRKVKRMRDNRDSTLKGKRGGGVQR